MDIRLELLLRTMRVSAEERGAFSHFAGPTSHFCAVLAHDINNLVKQVLATNTFKLIALQAAMIVNAINASSSKWLQCLRDIVKRKHGKVMALCTLCETRWNSMQACFASRGEVDTCESLLLAYQHRRRLPDSYVECEETQALYEPIHPELRARMPSRKDLGGRILRRRAQICELRAESDLKSR